MVRKESMNTFHEIFRAETARAFGPQDPNEVAHFLASLKKHSSGQHPHLEIPQELETHLRHSEKMVKNT
jgi:hypothetical protein